MSQPTSPTGDGPDDGKAASPPSPPKRTDLSSSGVSSDSFSADTDTPKRMPSLRSLSDPESPLTPASSSPLSHIANARNPRNGGPTPPSASSLLGGPNSNAIMERMRAFHSDRMQKAAASSPSPAPGLLRVPPGSIRPTFTGSPQSAPAIPSLRGGKMSLSERRMGNRKFGPLPGNRPGRRPGAPKLSDMQGGPSAGGPIGSKLDDFKQYLDTENGWITFDGAATIMPNGVDFANGKTFRISLDEIELLEELGKGNYGTVYKVRHAKSRVPTAGLGHGLAAKRKEMAQARLEPMPSRKRSQYDSVDTTTTTTTTTTGRIMAMKEIRLELDDAKFTTILKELVILHKCRSPYIIDFYGAFYQDSAVFMCIEHMDGGSIDKLYAGGIPESVLRKITYSTVMGLRTLKDEHNIIHRDVKPTNILVNTRGQTKICDFGVSGNLVASIAKTNIGCQSYMAPERIAGGGMSTSGNPQGTYSVQSDIWSLGLSIIECAMGRYPYPPEVSSTIFSQLNAIVEGEPPALPETGFSEMAHDFVKGCLNKTPSKRPTYAMLLSHPWLKLLSRDSIIIEEDDEAAEAAASMDRTDEEAEEKVDLAESGEEEAKAVEAAESNADEVGEEKPADKPQETGGDSPVSAEKSAEAKSEDVAAEESQPSQEAKEVTVPCGDNKSSGQEHAALDDITESLADASISQHTEDPEVAAWVIGVLERSKAANADSQRPALHNAPLDSVKPRADAPSH